MTSETASERTGRELVVLGDAPRVRATHRVHGWPRAAGRVRALLPWLIAAAFGAAMQPWTWRAPSTWTPLLIAGSLAFLVAVAVVWDRGRRR